MKNALVTIFGVALFCSAMYGAYWAVKTASYAVFYEGRVEDTVRGMVKSECLPQK